MTAASHLHHIARDPDANHGLYNRTPEALTVIDARNVNQIIADEYAESWLARHGFKIGAALMVITFAAVTMARAADKLEADLDLYHQFRSMK